ncbi:hypothetical protein N7532_011216, partial [Penicillium argentinense]
MSTDNRDRYTTDTSGGGIAHGSSTGAPGIPTGLHATRAQYNPATAGYNPATGASYSKASAGGPHQSHHQPASPSNSYDAAGQDDRIQHAPSTAQRVQMDEEEEKIAGQKSRTGSKSANMGENVGKKAQGVIAGVHGAGESLRGSLTAAVDRTFGSEESAEWNEEIARRGEREIRSGQYAGHPESR